MTPPASPVAGDDVAGGSVAAGDPARARAGTDRRDPAPGRRATPLRGTGPERPTREVPAGAARFATFEDDLRDDYEPEPARRRLVRSQDDRLVGGVAGGLGRHFDIDPLIFRIALRGPDLRRRVRRLRLPGRARRVPARGCDRPRCVGARAHRGAGLLAAAALARSSRTGSGARSCRGLLVAGGIIYLLVRVVRDDGASHLGRIAARIALGIALLSLAAAASRPRRRARALGGGILIAGLVIALGVALVGGAFRGGARWLIVPAFVLALPLGVVSAADLELEGDWGERTFRPASVARARRRLRDGRRATCRSTCATLDLPAGRTELPLKLGVGEIEVPVPDDTCVTYDIDVGGGDVTTLDGELDGGVDLDVSGDARRAGRRARAARDRRPRRRRGGHRPRLRRAGRPWRRGPATTSACDLGAFDGPAAAGLPGDVMKARPGFDPGSLVAGLIVIELGIVLLLDRTGVLDLRFDYWWPALAAVGGVLLACGLAGPQRARLTGVAPSAVAVPGTRPEPLRRDRSRAVVGGRLRGPRTAPRRRPARPARRLHRRLGGGRRRHRRCTSICWALLPAAGEGERGLLGPARCPGARARWWPPGSRCWSSASCSSSAPGASGSATRSCGPSCSPPAAAR